LILLFLFDLNILSLFNFIVEIGTKLNTKKLFYV
jgi:hypothetical protein